MSTITAVAAPGGLRGLWDRQLPHYPDTARRMWYLAITIVATITLYYALFVQGAVAPQIIAQYHFSFTEFVGIVAVGATFGAFASLAAGLADRWGRANLVVGGLLVTGLLVTFAMPNASGKAEYAVCYALVSIVEGICLVATPALIRDFSPQVGRAAAMAFWTMGPVLGSLVVTEVSSHTLPSHPDWRYQFQLCGVVGLVVWVIALIGLRELSPRLRDQLMVSLRDRALVEARAAGIDPEAALKGHWRQMLRVNITGSAFAISLFLVLFYVITAFAVVFLGTVFGYPASRANAVANWYWITAAITMLVIGFASDRSWSASRLWSRAPSSAWRGRLCWRWRRRTRIPAITPLPCPSCCWPPGSGWCSLRGWPGSPRRWRSGTRPRRRPGWRCGAGRSGLSRWPRSCC